MQLQFKPRNHPEALVASVAGDVLTLNGVTFDFSQLTDGDVLPAHAIDTFWIEDDVTRVGGEIKLTLILPHGSNAPEETRFPEPIQQTEDGPVPLPPYTIKPEPEEPAP